MTGGAAGGTLHRVRQEIARLDATAQAELVRRGELRPGELVEAAIERIERVDARLNAVVIRLFEEARACVAGQLPPAPFRGVPFLMKDVGARQGDQPYYAGNRALRDVGFRAASDTPLGARFRALGLVTVGKSNTPEFGLQSTTQPLAFGPTRNPWDPARSAGGSSGGACAAVAAGLVPVAHASDGGGSIRIPAAWCGLVGLKPSRGRIVARPGLGPSEVEFVVARSLRDTARFLDLLGSERASAGPEVGSAPPRALRVGFVTESPMGSVHPACKAAVARTVSVLASLGHAVETSYPAALFEVEERSLHGALLGPAHYRECLAELEMLLGRPVGPEDVEPYLWELAHLGGEAAGRDAIRNAERFLRGWAARVESWWRDHDLLVTPTLPEPPCPLETLDPSRLAPLALLERMLPHMAFTEPFNVTGQPALSLPLSETDDGLPVGVQLVAARGRENLLLGVAAGLEAAMPWEGRRPTLHA